MDTIPQLNDLSIAIDPFLKSTNYTVGIALLNLTVALLMGAAIAFVYKRHFQGTVFQKSYATDLMLATAVTSLVIMLISGNLILSLGMVGALSIVRFRTAVKDPSDTIYMFWAIAVGIGSGIGFHKITFTGSLAIFVALEIASRVKSTDSATMIVVSSSDSSGFQDALDAIKLIDRKSRMRSQTVSGQGWELVMDTTKTVSAQEVSNALNTSESKSVDIRCFSYDANV